MPLQLKPRTPLTPPLAKKPTPGLPAKPKSRRPKSRRAILASLTPETVFNTRWFISQAAGDALAFEYLMMLKAGGLPMLSWDDDEEDDEDPDNQKPEWYSITDDGIACIPVRGTMVKSDYDFAYGWATSYGCVMSMCADALSRAEVKAILFRHDSPGGMANGMIECADYLYSVRDQKPMAAISDDACYSASYCLAASVGQMFVSPSTGGVGSVGCWMAHANISKMLEDMGVKITLIQSGAKKTDGNPYQALPERVEAEWKDEADRLRGLFAQSVARSRLVSVDALLNTEAGIFMSTAACPLMADAVGTVADAMAYLRTKIAAAGTPEDPQGGAPGDREGPFAITQNQPITISYTTDDGKAWTHTVPGIVQVGTMSVPSVFNGPFVGLVPPPEESAFLLEDAEGSSHNYRSDYIELMGTELASMNASGQADKRRWWNFTQRASLLSGLKSIKAEHPNAFAAVRKLERRASVNGDRKITLLAAPYAGVAQLSGFKEVYRPGCFQNGLSGDMRVLWNHADSQMYVLGRTSAGTARFYTTEEGLMAEADAPETQWASDLLVSMRRGDVTEASLGFWILEAEYETRADGRYRVITKAVVHDASVESFGAYSESTATVAQPEEQRAEVVHDGNRNARLANYKRRLIL